MAGCFSRAADIPLSAANNVPSDQLAQGLSDLDQFWHESRDKLAPRIAIGAVSGLAATSAMTAAMLGMKQKLPWFQRYPLPPRMIVDRVARWIGIRKDLNKQNLNALTGVAHFGYGAAAGAIYGPVGLALQIPGFVSGVAWGLLVWAGSYLGLLPGLNILQSAVRQPRNRVLLMILAHVVWGANLGLATAQLAKRFGQD